MSCLAQLSGTAGGRILPGAVVLACAFTLGAVTATRADEPTILRVNRGKIDADDLRTSVGSGS